MTTILRATPLPHAAHPASISLARPGFEMRRVASREDWKRARSVRYDSLRSREEIAESPEHSYEDPHDSALNTMTFVLTRNARTLGTTRSSLSSARRRWALPAMDVFAGEIEAKVGMESTIVEASLTAVDPATSADPRLILFHLLKAPMLHCAAENADWLIAAVRDSQIGFYRRMFNMEILSGMESYPGMTSARVLMGLEFRRHAPLLFKRIPVLAFSVEDEREFAATGAVSFPEERRAA